MTFRNPIIGSGDVLVRDAIQSENYEPGVSGWRIERTGDAELNGVVVRGVLRTGSAGQYIVIDGTGADGNKIQFYSGAPAETAPGVLAVDQPNEDASLTLQPPDLGAGDMPALILTSATTTDGMAVLLYSPGTISISGTAAEIAVAQVLNVSADTITLSSSSGTTSVAENLAVAGDINLPQGSYVRRGAMATPTFQNGWGNYGAPFQPVRYIEYPDGTGGLTGVANGGTTTGGTVLFTLPAQVRPGADHVFTVPSTSGKHAQIVVRANGQVALQNPDSGITWLGLSGCRWPLAAFDV